MLNYRLPKAFIVCYLVCPLISLYHPLPFMKISNLLYLPEPIQVQTFDYPSLYENGSVEICSLLKKYRLLINLLSHFEVYWTYDASSTFYRQIGTQCLK